MLMQFKVLGVLLCIIVMVCISTGVFVCVCVGVRRLICETMKCGLCGQIVIAVLLLR